MSEKQPKLKFEEEKERTATRSPPKKSKVEQSVPKKQKLKQDADKAAEKSQHLRFGKAEITPDEASLMTIATMIPMVMSRAFMISFRGQSVVLRRESNPFLPDVNRFRRKKSDFLPLSRTFSGKTLTFTGNGSIIHTVPNHSQRRLYSH